MCFFLHVLLILTIQRKSNTGGYYYIHKFKKNFSLRTVLTMEVTQLSTFVCISLKRNVSKSWTNLSQVTKSETWTGIICLSHSQSVCTTVVQSRTFICILVLQMFRQSVGLTLLRPLTNTVTTCPWTSVSVASQGCPPPRPHSPPPLQPPPLSPQPSDQGKVSLSIPHPKKKNPKISHQLE